MSAILAEDVSVGGGPVAKELHWQSVEFGHPYCCKQLHIDFAVTPNQLVPLDFPACGSGKEELTLDGLFESNWAVLRTVSGENGIDCVCGLKVPIVFDASSFNRVA